jgi:glycosyltransferase involved in cell wall biosynthesis
VEHNGRTRQVAHLAPGAPVGEARDSRRRGERGPARRSDEEDAPAAAGSAARVLILVVAYEAESTLARVLSRIPDSVFEHDTEILVIDDSSRDGTFVSGLEWSRASRHRTHVLSNRENQGYGGNQKLGYRYAVLHRFDFVVLLHGDGQYAPEVIPNLLAPLIAGSADAVFGSRMMTPGAARRGGMPLYKLLGNRILTAIQNRLLGSSLSELHSGFRAYRVAVLERIPFQYNTQDFHFDTEIIIQLLLAGCRIQEIPIPTYYGDEICRVNGLVYAKNVLFTTCASRVQRWNVLYDRKFDVAAGTNSFYDLKLGYTSSHTLALGVVPPGARVLDVGCGPGLFAERLAAKGCMVTGVDQYPPALSHVFEDFLQWEEGEPFPNLDLGRYDVVLLLDVIEHMRRPEALLDRLRALARDARRRPTFVVTSGNVSFVVVRLQALLGNFNYGKRGILDLTHTRLYTFGSLRRLFEQCGYRLEQAAGIPAPFPKALGPGRLSHALVRLNELLLRLWKRLFAYQILLVARPDPSLEALLEDTLETSHVRATTLYPRHRRTAP